MVYTNGFRGPPLSNRFDSDLTPHTNGRGFLFTIRTINPKSSKEISLVASRMQKTLIDVLGKAKGESLYSMDWLVERVNWHLAPERVAQVLLAETQQQEIVGQAIVRLEENSEGHAYGYFSTIYVAPEYRNQGVAKKLIQEITSWSLNQGFPYIIYNTARDNDRLIGLFQKFGFLISLTESDMVQLKKTLTN